MLTWQEKETLNKILYNFILRKNSKTKPTVALEMNWIPILGGMTTEQAWGTSLHKVIPLQLYANPKDYLTLNPKSGEGTT